MSSPLPADVDDVGITRLELDAFRVRPDPHRRRQRPQQPEDPAVAAITVLEDVIDGHRLTLGWWTAGHTLVLVTDETGVTVLGLDRARALATTILEVLQLTSDALADRSLDG